MGEVSQLVLVVVLFEVEFVLVLVFAHVDFLDGLLGLVFGIEDVFPEELLAAGEDGFGVVFEGELVGGRGNHGFGAGEGEFEPEVAGGKGEDLEAGVSKDLLRDGVVGVVGHQPQTHLRLALSLT